MNSYRVMRQSDTTFKAEIIDLSHGAGGRAMRALIQDVFINVFDSPQLNALEDQASIELSILNSYGSRLAVTTDSYVIDPIFFPGGDIGKLAVCGTINDLVVGGATPLYLTCALILEEGFSVSDLRRIVASMKTTADAAGVKIIAGDTKVVNRGAADKIFITTTGVGVIPEYVKVSVHNAVPGDVILVNGFIGDHGAAIVAARGDLSIESDIQSDCQPLNSLVEDILRACPQVHCMRDATRGGIASVLNEFAIASGCCITLDQKTIPMRSEVRGICEILGLDPLYLANEGKVIVVLPKSGADAALSAMRRNPYGIDSAIIGEVGPSPIETVILQTEYGAKRIVDMLTGDQLPRIC